MKTKMVELLTSGDISKDFNRLGIQIKEVYKGKRFSIHELTKEEFKVLCEEPDIENTWVDCGWRQGGESNLGKVNSKLIVNNKELKCWQEHDWDKEDFEMEELFEEKYVPTYSSLLEYLEIEIGCSTFNNICSCVTDLAKQNKMKISELFKLYQG